MNDLWASSFCLIYSLFSLQQLLHAYWLLYILSNHYPRKGIIIQRAPFYVERENFPKKSGLVWFCLSQVGKFRFFLFAIKMFLYLVKLQSETFARAFLGFLMISAKTFLFLVKLYSEMFTKPLTQIVYRFFYIAFTRTISLLGVCSGPEKDQVLMFLGETILLGPLPSNSSCELHILGHNGHPSGMYCTQIGILQYSYQICLCRFL